MKLQFETTLARLITFMSVPVLGQFWRSNLLALLKNVADIIGRGVCKAVFQSWAALRKFKVETVCFWSASVSSRKNQCEGRYWCWTSENDFCTQTIMADIIHFISNLLKDQWLYEIQKRIFHWECFENWLGLFHTIDVYMTLSVSFRKATVPSKSFLFSHSHAFMPIVAVKWIPRGRYNQNPSGSLMSYELGFWQNMTIKNEKHIIKVRRETFQECENQV